MSEYNLNIKGKLKLGDFCDIQDYVNIVDFQDKLTVVLDSAESQEIDMIQILLINGNFNISEISKDNYGKTFIKAYKNL